MKAELETKIADILAKYYLLPIDSMDSTLKCNTWCDDVAKEITKLVEQPQIKLPSVEEICKLAKDKYRESDYASFKIIAFADGMECMRDLIKQQMK